MATLFDRKYFRKLEWLSPIEMTIGVLLLLLTGGIVAAYIVQSLSDGSPLFVASKGGDEADPAKEIAARLLPGFGDSTLWAAPVEVVPREAWGKTLGMAADQVDSLGLVRVYRRDYKIAKQGGVIGAVVCDCGTPQQAFGAMNAGRPADAASSSLGRGGWRTPERVAFWSGRFYTVAALTKAGETQGPLLERVAATIAERQLDYGGPFSLERLLPPEGRVADSLRYWHRNAFGVDFLHGVFAVELAGGVTAWAMEAADATEATRVAERLEEAAPRSAPVSGGHADESGGYDEGGSGQTSVVAPPLVRIDWGGGSMVYFAEDRYVCGALADDANAAIAAAKTAYAIVSAKSSRSAGAPASQDDSSEGDGGDNPFPAIDVGDWRPPSRVSRFTPDTLYQKINGRAGLYLQFKVASMTFGAYESASGGDRTIDVYWYDMGEAQNALGIYGSELPGHVEAVKIGKQGYQADGAVFFIKGASYVQVIPSGTEEEDAKAAMAIATRISGGIEDVGDDMWATKALPRENQVPDSFEYIAEDAFGLDHLQDVFSAEYDLPGGRLTFFIVRAENEAAAKTLMKRHRAVFEEYGEEVWADPDASRMIVAGDAAGVIDVVFVKGRYFGGVSGAEDLDVARKAAVEFYNGLEMP